MYSDVIPQHFLTSVQIDVSSFKSSQLRQGELWVGGSVIFVISGVGLVG